MDINKADQSEMYEFKPDIKDRMRGFSQKHISPRKDNPTGTAQ